MGRGPQVKTAAYDLGNPAGREDLVDALTMHPPRLDLAALAIAKLGNSELDYEPSLARLDALAAKVSQRIDRGAAEALTSVLAGEEGFEGDRVVYGSPENSFLDQVLERRRGLPILLSVLYIEVGRRAGLQVTGVALPGHFIVLVEDSLVDPFNKGQLLTREDCQRIVKRASPSFDFTDEMLVPPSARAIAARMLNNLKSSWLQQAETDAALSAVDMLLTLFPKHPSELRLRAGLLMELGAFRASLSDIETCLAEVPAPPDLESLMKTADSLRERIGRLH